MTTPNPLPSGKRRFEIRKWNAVALWSWDIPVDNCAICRNHIMDLCIECQSQSSASMKQTNDECTVVWGVCNHAFHKHCISTWLQNRPTCPLDNKKWNYQILGESASDCAPVVGDERTNEV